MMVLAIFISAVLIINSSSLARVPAETNQIVPRAPRSAVVVSPIHRRRLEGEDRLNRRSLLDFFNPPHTYEYSFEYEPVYQEEASGAWSSESATPSSGESSQSTTAAAAAATAPADSSDGESSTLNAQQSSNTTFHSEFTSSSSSEQVSTTLNATSSTIAKKEAAAAASAEVSSSSQFTFATLPSTCDKVHVKYSVNSYLKACSSGVEPYIKQIASSRGDVNDKNVKDSSGEMLKVLKSINSLLQKGLVSIQTCGYDKKPLTDDQGVSLTILADSAFEVIQTIYPAFDTISSLYESYPHVEDTLSDTLKSISTTLSGLISACGEQINLFDTKFFKLVTPVLSEYSGGEKDHFLNFIGTFDSRK